MILVTGGAGFIGSNLHAALAACGVETVIVDRLRDSGKWRNLAAHPPARLVPPEALDDFLDSHPPIELVFHLGAISATTATDGDLVWATNVELPLRLWHWCAARGVRLVYASSAATYGDGRAGFEDGLEGLDRLRPLNLYGWSKHAFDRSVARLVATGAPRPPQWAGLKFFNVYGPGEDHKGAMISAVRVKLDEARAGTAPRLFRSDRPDIADGEQKRDFIWVGDTVDVMLWLMDHPQASGLFNVGTGTARSFRALAEAACTAAGMAPQLAFIDMPAALRGHYQSFTEAPMARLRAAGYGGAFTTLEDGVARYAAALDPRGGLTTAVQFFPDSTTFLVLGPLVLRWSALAYIGGLVIGWRWLRRLVEQAPTVATPLQADEFLTWATIGVVGGGRLGYVLFYQPSHFLAQPLEIFAVWHGGMSFHGGMLGVVIATVLFCRRGGIPLLGFADRVAVVAPVGLFLGRLANFANGELWGRPAPDWVPWPLAMTFATGGDVLRYSSQLYQAALEGVVLLLVMTALARRDAIRARAGTLAGAFLCGYAVARTIGELFRQPDAFLGFLVAGTTMGQLLSLPMLAAGLWLILRARRQPA